MNAAVKECRICGSDKTKLIGTIKSDNDLNEFKAYDCSQCQNRFVYRHFDVHENMHADNQSPYFFHENIAKKIHGAYLRKDLKFIERYFSKDPRFKFIDNALAGAGKDIEICEIGCSVGYTTSYFILKGYNILGVDISQTAINKAASYFGNHFALLDNNFFEKHEGQFNYVFLLGTIGCVDNPVRFIENILRICKPGGKVLLNAPNVAAAKEMNSVWINGTTPPDLITLFSESFWINYFKNVALTQVEYKPYSHMENAKRHIISAFRVPYFSDKVINYKIKNNSGSKISVMILRVIKNILIFPVYLLSVNNQIKHFKLNYGMFVMMNKFK